MSLLAFDEIVRARQQIGEGVLLTPCPLSLALSERYGCHIYCKLDCLQRTGSVQEIVHDRTFSGPNVAAVNVLCTVETRDEGHIAALSSRLNDASVRHFAHLGRWPEAGTDAGRR